MRNDGFPSFQGQIISLATGAVFEASNVPAPENRPVGPADDSEADTFWPSKSRGPPVFTGPPGDLPGTGPSSPLLEAGFTELIARTKMVPPSRPTHEEYSRALENARLVQAAHSGDPEETFAAFAAEQGWVDPLVFHDPSTGMDVCVACDPDSNQVVVAVPGTYGWQDTLQDARFELTEADGLLGGGDGVLVLKGFAEQSQAVLEFLLGTENQPGYLATHGNADTTVRIAGHSLGGAVATLVAGALAHRGYHVEELTTFGAPRVGNGEAAAAAAVHPHAAHNWLATQCKTGHQDHAPRHRNSPPKARGQCGPPAPLSRPPPSPTHSPNGSLQNIGVPGAVTARSRRPPLLAVCGPACAD